MLEQQLVDYIKKAKAAGQSDEQTRALLYKNGWSEEEVGEAYTSLSQPQTQPQPQPQQPQVRPQVQPQPQPVQPQAQPQAQPQPQPRVQQKSYLLPKLLIVLIILAVLVAAGYYIYLNLMSQPSPIIESPAENPVEVIPQNNESELPVQPEVSPEVQKIMEDLSDIAVSAQLQFDSNSDFTTVCYKGLLNGYNEIVGEDLIALNNDIISQGGGKPVCFGAASGFCVSTQLEDKTYMCIDEKGAIGATKCEAAATVCE